MKAAIAIVILLTFTAPALAGSYTADCRYTASVAANMTKANGIQIDVNHNDNFEMHFSFGSHTANKRTSKGFIRGNQGVAPISVFWGMHSITFIEFTATGAAMVTAIYGKPNGKFASVHSRATGGPGWEMPSQYYGTCELKAVKGPLRKKMP